jgi:ribosomal protein S18 acetylase RimI-like enzyme
VVLFIDSENRTVPNVSLRPATPADAAIVAEYNRRLAYESEGKTLDAAVLMSGVAKVLADAHKGFYTLAEIDGEVVGQTLITYEWSDWRDGWFWWIQSVYVRADARGHGVFRALYNHLHTRAVADPDVIGIRLYVEQDNTKAQAIYHKLGLENEGYFLLGKYPLNA